MSDQSSMPYHLRQNKAIDRNIFVECLQKIGRCFNISNHQYIGFGGIFLEDFKAIHSGCRISNMISIESDANIYNRQKFNTPIKTIKLLNTTSGAFIDEGNFDSNVVFWLDYVKPKEIYSQLNEINKLAAKLVHGDILKISINCTPETLGATAQGDLQEHRYSVFKSRVDDYCPSIATEIDITNARYPQLLVDTIKIALDRQVGSDSELEIFPLAIYTYKDGQRMLSVTLIFLNKNEVPKFIEASRIHHWQFYSSEWRISFDISVPSFSLKERLHLEAETPFMETTPQIVHEKFGYFFAKGEDESRELLENFSKFYRLYPQYSKISV